MNIFATYACPVKSAEYLDDQRLVKMTLESCQMLSTCAAFYGVWNEAYARPTHVNHPCNVWCREARSNFVWLYEHAIALDNERRRRWNRDRWHATLSRLDAAGLWRTERYLPYGQTKHVNAARHSGYSIDFTHIQDVHKAYRLYLQARWRIQTKPAQCFWRPSGKDTA